MFPVPHPTAHRYICQFIVEEFSTDIATWLLGEPVELGELSPKELSLEPIPTDSLILRQSEEIVLHAEFQTDVDVILREGKEKRNNCPKYAYSRVLPRIKLFLDLNLNLGI